MTQDEFFELANQAGKEAGLTAFVFHPVVEIFAKLVAAKEREACAKMVDHILKEGGGTWGDAIRARGQA